MIGGAKGIGIGIDFGIPNQYCRATSKPYIEKDVLDSLRVVASAYGKSNDDADRSIVKNLVDASNPFIISNAAFKLNSGFGKYEVDFTSWIQTNGVIASSDKVQNSITGRFLYFNTVNKKEDVPSFKVNITLGQQSKLQYNYIKEDGTTTYIVYSESGIYTIPASYFSKYTGVNAWFGFYQIEGTSIIEQIPSFEGAFVTDGIDDLITSTKTVQEMLGGSSEITVVSMIHQIGFISSRNYARNNYFIQGNDFLTNTISAIGKIGIYGYKGNLSNIAIVNDILGDKKDYSVDKANPANIDSVFSVNGTHSSAQLSQLAWYWTIIANKVLTTDQINQVIAYFNLDRTLRPDILCNITKQGITNDNHADFNDKLIDYSGNGRDIQMYNLAWKGGSGVAAKQYETFKDWTSESSSTSIIKQIDEFTRIVESTTNDYWVSRIKRDYDLDKVYDPINVYLYQDNNFLVHECKYEVDGVKYAIPINEPVGKGYHKLEMYTKDRYTELPENAENVVLSEWYFPKSTKGSIKYSIIPSCKGGILLDGINDFGKVINMPVYKDYTFIIDYERISYTSPEVWTAGVVSKAHLVGQGAFILMLANREVELSRQSNSFGSTTTFNRDDFTRTLLYQSKYKCGDVNLTVGGGVDGDTLWLGTLRDNDYRFFNGAIYSLMSFPYSMSKFLIERQLKKHKLGTLYPNMVEFRPVIKKDDRIKSIKYYIDGKTANIGQYYPIGTGLGIAVETVQPYMVKSLKVNGVNTIPNVDYKVFNARLDSKSPQKITMDIQVDTNLIQWNPIITSTVELTTAPIFAIRGTSTLLKPGDWIPKNSEIWVIVTMNNLIDELRKFSFNGTFINIPSSSYNPDTGKYGFPFVIDNESTQNINLTIDEYIRFEDIVQPYPVLLRFNNENGNEVSWGGKFRVGSTITRIGSIADPESNLLNGLYSVSGLSLNGKAVTSAISIVEKQMVFKTTVTWLLDNNEPKCILSPRLLRIPNSSYKILGYIPDISGHGNHGKINNSAYAEGSGVNEDGSYQFDGVDDFVTIPTLSSGGKQVLMKVNWDKTIADAILYDQRGYPNEFAIYNADVDNNNNPVFAYQARNNGQTYIDGILNKNIKASELRAITHNITITNELSTGTNTSSPIIGSNRVRDAYFTKMALYDFMLFDNISTDDKIKELNEYVGIEAKVELPPYYWDAYGKTNLDADKATIQQRGVAVGDYDLTNYNHAYDKMSGYGGYSLGRFDKSWASPSSNNTSVIVVSQNPYDITLKKLGGNSDWEFNNTELKVISNPVSVKFKSNKNIRVKCDYHYYPVGGNSEGAPLGTTSKDLIANKDAIITISPISQENIDKYNIDVNRGYYLIYFQLSSTLAVNEEVTIEMLPLYPNGLVYDGVDDYSKNENIPVLTDYTIIAKRLWINKDNPLNEQFIHKGAINTPISESAFMLEYEIVNDTYYRSSSYGGYINIERSNRPERIVYQTSNSYNGISITKGSGTDTTGIVIGGVTNNYWNGVFYKLMLYSKTLPLLQINYLKNLMEKDEIIDLNNKIFIQ